MFIHYLNLPPVPKSIINLLPKDYDSYIKKVNYGNGLYIWTDDFNEEINQWCKENICDSMHYGFQIINGDLPPHKDLGTFTKLIYLIETGGDNVATNFHPDDDQTKILDSYVIETNKWHILKADTFHSVTNTTPGKVRFSITGRLFGE